MTKREIYNYNATLNRAIDGDTVDLWVDLGFRLFHNVRCRLADIDTPERGQRGYAECREKLVELLSRPLVIRTSKTGKYGRWIVHFVSPNDVVSKMRDFMKEHRFEKR